MNPSSYGTGGSGRGGVPNNPWINSSSFLSLGRLPIYPPPPGSLSGSSAAGPGSLISSGEEGSSKINNALQSTRRPLPFISTPQNPSFRGKTSQSSLGNPLQSPSSFFSTRKTGHHHHHPPSTFHHHPLEYGTTPSPRLVQPLPRPQIRPPPPQTRNPTGNPYGFSSIYQSHQSTNFFSRNNNVVGYLSSSSSIFDKKREGTPSQAAPPPPPPPPFSLPLPNQLHQLRNNRSDHRKDPIQQNDDAISKIKSSSGSKSYFTNMGPPPPPPPPPPRPRPRPFGPPSHPNDERSLPVVVDNGRSPRSGRCGGRGRQPGPPLGVGGVGIARKPDAPTKRMCQVCGVVPYQFHHYGSYVCNRCRAFFRRMVRRHRKGGKSGICITTKGDPYRPLPVCDISLFRGACPACRYVTCLKVGMNPKLVLTDDVRTKRYSRSKRTQDRLVKTLIREEKEIAQIQEQRKIRQQRNNSSSSYSNSRRKSAFPYVGAFSDRNSKEFRNNPPVSTSYNSSSSQDQIGCIDNGTYKEYYSVSFSWRAPIFSTARLRTPPNYGGFLPPPPSHKLKSDGSIYYEGPVLKPPWLEEKNSKNQELNLNQSKNSFPNKKTPVISQLVDILDNIVSPQPPPIPTPPPPCTPPRPVSSAHDDSSVSTPPKESFEESQTPPSISNVDDLSRILDLEFDSNPSETLDIMMRTNDNTTEIDANNFRFIVNDEDVANANFQDLALESPIYPVNDGEIKPMKDEVNNDKSSDYKVIQPILDENELDHETETRERLLQTPSILDCGDLLSPILTENFTFEIDPNVTMEANINFEPSFSPLIDPLDTPLALGIDSIELFPAVQI